MKEQSIYGTICLTVYFRSFSVYSFRRNLDRFLYNQDVCFNYKAPIAGTGNRNILVLYI